MSSIGNSSLKNIKKAYISIEFLKNNIVVLILLCAGVVMLTLPTGQNALPAMTDVEKNLKLTLEKAEGVGEVDVMVTRGEDGETIGAIIVAEGVYKPEIKKLVHDSAVSVLNVPAYKVQVLTKRK